MGFFNNSNKSYQSTRSDSTTTIITAGTKIIGDISLSCNLYIDGCFTGNINSEKEITVGKNGKVQGEITAQRVIVQGLIEGSICATRVDIKEKGKITGSVESEEFVIEAKGIFEGNSLVKISSSSNLSIEDHKERETLLEKEEKIEENI